MLKISHRGVTEGIAGNTIEAFSAAIEAGIDCIELDLRLSCDGRIVVFHDEGFNEDLLIFQMSFLQIKAKGHEETIDIPSLEEVFEAVGEKAMLDLEVKTIEVVPLLVEILKGRNSDKIIVSSFDEYVSRDVKKAIPSVKTALVSDSKLFNILSVLESAKADIIVQRFEYIDKDTVDTLHNDRKKIFAWTVNDEADIKKMVEFDVDGIITDYPRKLDGLVDDSKSFLL